jgi:predicted transcriptional regulator
MSVLDALKHQISAKGDTMPTTKKASKKATSTRMYVTVAPQTMKRLDSIAKRYGVSRSSLISLILGQYCESTEKAFAAIPEAMKNVLAGAVKDDAPSTQ